MRMHKRTYRARKIKDLKMTDLLNLVRGQRVVVTTDVAKTDMVSSIELWDGTSATLVKWLLVAGFRAEVDWGYDEVDGKPARAGG